MEKSLVLCDIDADYARAFASYLMGKIRNIHISIFTTEESFFADDGNYDYGIMSKEFIELLSFKQNLCIEKTYYLTENEYDEDDAFESIYKYQNMDSIINSIKGLNGADRSGKKRQKGKALITGIYSPVAHELQLPFAMSLAQTYKDSERVLFVDFEEISIMRRLINESENVGLMDLLYKLHGGSSEEGLVESFIYSYMGVDYIPPFMAPEEINEINSGSFKSLFLELQKLEYDRIVVLFGRTVSGFSEILSSIDQLIVVSKPGDYYQKSTDIFLKYLDAIRVDISVSTVQLSMTANNLSDGTYCIEELLQGNLGSFVKQIVEDNKKAYDMVAYG